MQPLPRSLIFPFLTNTLNGSSSVRKYLRFYNLFRIYDTSPTNESVCITQGVIPFLDADDGLELQSAVDVLPGLARVLGAGVDGK